MVRGPAATPGAVPEIQNLPLLLYRVQAEEAEREGDTESERGSRPRAVSTEPDAGLEPMNCEITNQAEVGRFTD